MSQLTEQEVHRLLAALVWEIPELAVRIRRHYDLELTGERDRQQVVIEARLRCPRENVIGALLDRFLVRLLSPDREGQDARRRDDSAEGHRQEAAMRRVVIESPFAGDVERNLRYLRACIRDCLRRDEAPFASHGLYTQPGVLVDNEPADRVLGIAAGFEWRLAAHATVVYSNLGITPGMQLGIGHAESIPGHVIEYRQLGGQW